MPDTPASEPAPADGAAWRRLGLERGAPGPLLERGADLLDELAVDPRPALRWYVPASPAIVVGRGQRVSDLRAEVPVLQRPTGGGAVLLDAGLLSLDVVLPADHPLLAGGLGEVFVRVGRAWAAALGALGVGGLTVHEAAGTATRLGGQRERLLAAICYATAGRGEVLCDGRKLVGLAQRRRRHGALIQCGLLRTWRPAPLLAALGADPGDPEIARAAVGLDELAPDRLPDRLDDEHVMAAVERALVAAAPA